MDNQILRPYADPSLHERVSRIIRERSDNAEDIRDTVFRGLDLSTVRDVLDLGCGYGFFSEALARRISPDATITGVDALAANEAPFLNRIAAAGRRANFLHWRIDGSLPWTLRSFDLVLCSYSLYFFSNAIPVIAAVLKPEGLLIAVTHSEKSFHGLFNAAGLQEHGTRLYDIVRRFSAENGARRLGNHFERIDRLDYPNALHFLPEHAEELIDYVRFKLPFMAASAQSTVSDPEAIRLSIRNHLLEYGELTIEKNDACFVCRGPICR